MMLHEQISDDDCSVVSQLMPYFPLNLGACPTDDLICLVNRVFTQLISVH